MDLHRRSAPQEKGIAGQKVEMNKSRLSYQILILQGQGTFPEGFSRYFIRN